MDKRALRVFEIAGVLVRLDHIASVIVNADHIWSLEEIIALL